MVMFHSYVSLAEGTWCRNMLKNWDRGHRLITSVMKTAFPHPHFCPRHVAKLFFPQFQTDTYAIYFRLHDVAQSYPSWWNSGWSPGFLQNLRCVWGGNDFPIGATIFLQLNRQLNPILPSEIWWNPNFPMDLRDLSCEDQLTHSVVRLSPSPRRVPHGSARSPLRAAGPFDGVGGAICVGAGKLGIVMSGW